MSYLMKKQTKWLCAQPGHPVYQIYLNCCSFLTSCSSAWKSIERSATMLLTTSTPASIFRMSFLYLVHVPELSTGAQSAALTRHGRTARRSRSLNEDNSLMSTFCIAWKRAGLTEMPFLAIFPLKIHISKKNKEAAILKFMSGLLG